MNFVLVFALLAADPAWRAAFLLTRAGDAFANKRYDESEQLFKSLLKVEPDNEVAFIHLAAIANKRNDRQAAATYLLTGVKSHPKSFAINHELGIALNALGRHKEAVPYLRMAVELEPRSFDARMNMGDAYAQVGQFDEALTNYEQALAVQGENPIALRQAGYAAFRKGDGNRAVRYLEQARKLLPTEWTIWK